jgi:hypothetical protein
MTFGLNNNRRGFDEATVFDENGKPQTLTPAQYEKLPLAARIRLVLEDRVSFHREGSPVPAREALKVSPR